MMLLVLIGASVALLVLGPAWWQRRASSRSAHFVEPERLSWRLVFPRGSRFRVAEATAWFSSLTPLLSGESELTVELRGQRWEIELRLTAARSQIAALRGQLAAWFPEARLEPVAVSEPQGPATMLSLTLAKPDLFPLRVPQPKEPDPLLGLLGVLAEQGQPSGVQIRCGPAPADWARWAPAALHALQQGRRLPPRGGWFGLWWVYHWFRQGAAPAAVPPRSTQAAAPALAGALTKAQQSVFRVRIDVWASDRSPAAGQQRVQQIAAQLQTGTAHPVGNRLVAVGGPRTVAALTVVQPRLPLSRTLSAAELATLYHLPDPLPSVVATEVSRWVAPPPQLPRPGTATAEPLTVLGEALTAAGPRPFGLTLPDRRLHTYVVGQTGTGKSTLLATMLRQDLEAGRGVGLLDPHGDLAERVLSLVPPERADQLLSFNPADTDFPMGFNLLAATTPAERPLVASGAISVFKRLFPDYWGPRLEYILRNALLAVLEAPAPSLLAVPRVLTDRAFRQRVLPYVRDPFLRYFFTEEWERADSRWRSEAAAPILNKLGAFLTSPQLRHIVGPSGPGFRLREVMDQGGIFIANLAVGRIGEDVAALLGGLLMAGFHLAALGRTRQPEEQRREFFLFVDEFQHLAGDSFAAILAEARKFGLALTLSHQFTAQLPPAMLEAVLGNAASLAVFRVGAPDAARLARELAPAFEAQDLVRLPNHRFTARIAAGGEILPAFSASTLSLPHGGRDISPLIEGSRRRWARPRAAVELEIADLWEGRLD
jgi:hypothetical protein